MIVDSKTKHFQYHKESEDVSGFLPNFNPSTSTTESEQCVS